MTLALPLRLKGDHIIDANGRLIALVRGMMDEYRKNGAEIVAAVNSRDCILDSRDKLRETRADLLAAAKGALLVMNNPKIVTEDATNHWIKVTRAAIAKAEQG